MSEEAIFQVFDEFSDLYRVAVHKEIMNDFPCLTKYASWKQGYSGYRAGLANTQNALGRQVDVSLFVPPSKYEEDADYFSRLATTAPFNIYKKTIQAVIGKMARKAAMTTIDEADLAKWEFLNNVDGENNSLDNFLSAKVYPNSLAGIGAIHVTYVNGRVVWENIETDRISRPHMVIESVSGIRTLKRAVIVSEGKTQGLKEYEYEKFIEAKVLKLIDQESLTLLGTGAELPLASGTDPDKYIAVWETFRNTTGKKMELTESGVYKSKAGLTYNMIPLFLYHTDQWNSPFFSAASMQLKLVDQESFFDQAIKISNFPMMVHKGYQALPTETTDNAPTIFKPQDNKPVVKISPRSLIRINPEESIEFLEYKGTSFQITTDRLAVIARQIIDMVINSLTDQTTQRRTKAEYQGQSETDTSLLSQLVNADEMAVRSAMAASAFYLGIDKVPSVTLNRDFVREVADPQLLAQVIAAWEKRFFSGDLAMKILRQKEIVEDRTTFEEQQEKIAEEPKTIALTYQQIDGIVKMWLAGVIDHGTAIAMLEGGGALPAGVNAEAMRKKAQAEMSDTVGNGQV